MKRIIIMLILTCIVTTYPASAAAGITDLDIFSVLPGLISGGLNAFLESIGDQLYEMAGVNNASQAQAGISLYMSGKNKFIESKGIQDQKDFNALAFLVVYILYMGYGAARLASEKGEIANGFVAQESYRKTYIKVLAIGLAFFMFYLNGIDWICTGEWLISSGFVTNAMNIMPKDAQHGIAYLFIAIGNIGVWVFMVIRDIVVYMVLMYILWLICMSKLPIVGYIFSMIIMYGIILFLSRSVIAFFFMAGTGAIEALGIGGLVIPYLVLVLLILGICIILLILPYLIMTASLGMIRGRQTVIHNHTEQPKEKTHE